MIIQLIPQLRFLFTTRGGYWFHSAVARGWSGELPRSSLRSTKSCFFRVWVRIDPVSPCNLYHQHTRDLASTTTKQRQYPPGAMSSPKLISIHRVCSNGETLVFFFLRLPRLMLTKFTNGHECFTKVHSCYHLAPISKGLVNIALRIFNVSCSEWSAR